MNNSGVEIVVMGQVETAEVKMCLIVEMWGNFFQVIISRLRLRYHLIRLKVPHWVSSVAVNFQKYCPM